MEIIPLIRCSNVVQTLLSRFGMVQQRVNFEFSVGTIADDYIEFMSFVINVIAVLFVAKRK